MRIEKDRVVTFHYQLFENNQKLEDSREEEQPVVYLHGHRNMLVALEDAMAGKESGDHLKITLPPERAYGPRIPNAVERVPVKHVLTRGKARPGSVVSISTREGPREVLVVKVGRFNLDVDTNHPFAGKTLHFEIDIENVREAEDEEIRHGHAHGPGGHQH